MDLALGKEFGRRSIGTDFGVVLAGEEGPDLGDGIFFDGRKGSFSQYMAAIDASFRAHFDDPVGFF